MLCCLGTQLAYGHSGGTDRRGGHHDRSNGTYHFHHGRRAHQHVNGRCEYTLATATSFFPKSKDNTKKNRVTKKFSPFQLEWLVLLLAIGCSFLLGYRWREKKEK